MTTLELERVTWFAPGWWNHAPLVVLDPTQAGNERDRAHWSFVSDTVQIFTSHRAVLERMRAGNLPPVVIVFDVSVRLPAAAFQAPSLRAFLRTVFTADTVVTPRPLHDFDLLLLEALPAAAPPNDASFPSMATARPACSRVWNTQTPAYKPRMYAPQCCPVHVRNLTGLTQVRAGVYTRTLAERVLPYMRHATTPFLASLRAAVAQNDIRVYKQSNLFLRGRPTYAYADKIVHACERDIRKLHWWLALLCVTLLGVTMCLFWADRVRAQTTAPPTKTTKPTGHCQWTELYLKRAAPE